MFVRAGLVALVLASPAWADFGLSGRSLRTLARHRRPGGRFSQRSPAVGRARSPSRNRASGDCHHYRDWRYPFPQPC